jgi:sugar phosphate permease
MFAMKTNKLFYGWYIVVASLVLAAYYHMTLGYGWTAFVNPIAATFGWSLAQVSMASSLRSLESGAFNPLWGLVVDRWPPRKLLRFGLILTALGAFCLSQTRNLAMFYAGFLIIGVGASLIVGILPLAVIARWFKKDIGKANGLFYMGAGLGGVAVPLVVATIDQIGWETTLLYDAIGFLVIGTALSFVIRRQPSDYGLLPDGKAEDIAGGSRPRRGAEFGTSIRKALKTRAFWYIGIVTLFQNSAMSTIMLFAIPYLTSLGIDRTTAGLVVMLYTLASLPGRMFLGILSDMFKKSNIIALSVVLQGVGLFLFWSIDGTSPFWLILLFAVVYGLGLGGVSVLRPPILVEYFGARTFGAIYGLLSIFITVATVICPPIAGWVFDTYHDYKPVWLALVAFAVVALVMIVAIPNSQKGTRSVTGLGSE